jgi:toxin ParE1/3/4
VRVIFTPLAERQIDGLHDYITVSSGEGRADGYISRIVAFCMGLATFPLRGQQREDLLPGLCTIGFERRITIAFVVAGGGPDRRNILRRTGLRELLQRRH